MSGYLLLLAPVIALILAEKCTGWTTAGAAVVLVGFVVCIMVRNESRPFLKAAFLNLPRERQYLFVRAPKMNGPTMQIAEAIAESGCRQVGLKLLFDEPEYPLWVMLRNRGFTGEVHHYFVEKESGRIQTDGFNPGMIVATRGKPPAVVQARFPFTQECGDLILLSTNRMDVTWGTALHELNQ